MSEAEREVRKCESWLVVNGEEIKCQWKDDHLGCHSAYATTPIDKVKWGDALQRAEQRGREEKMLAIGGRGMGKSALHASWKDGWRKGLLRGADIAKGPFDLPVLNDAGDIISNLIHKEAEA